MSFLKKLSATVKETASNVSAKSADLVEAGKLKLKKNQLETLIKDKKLQIGEIIYTAYQQKTPPDETVLMALYADTEDYEAQVVAIDEQLKKEIIPQEASTEVETAPEATKIFCTNCGTEASPEDRFCKNCGKEL